ncbi:MAG: TonB-dependent receptor [Mediterranea sp.]|nr:TonB-dependent receptor [Mediterranea sp.]
MKRTSSFMLMMMVCLMAFAQTKTVKGTVKDTSGEPIIGANVLVKGTANGVITDLDGNYTLPNVKNTDVLVVSYIGYINQEVRVGTQSTIDITLTEDAKALEEVVVIGYGSVKRKDLTGSVATVSSKEITAVPVASVSEALTGKMAGVQVTTTEGSPDAAVSIRVRGGGSITQSNEPLYIVDGFTVSSISDIPSSEIEDITVLKDASSTAIYGARGANGVILVTTKSAKEGKTSVSYSAYYSWKTVAKTMDVLSARDYTDWQYELALLHNDEGLYTRYFGNYQDIDMYDNVATNDWQDLTFGRTGKTFNHSVNISGGTDKLKYTFSYTHMDDKAIMEMSSFKRDNANLKLNHKPLDNISIDLTARFSRSKIIGGGANDANSSLNTDKRLKYAIQYTPYPIPGLSDALAADIEEPNSQLVNPLTALRDNDMRKERINYNLAAAFTWEIIKNLNVKTEYGYDDYRDNVNRFYGPTTYYVRNTPTGDDQGKPGATLTRQSRSSIRNTNTVNYDFEKIFRSDKHSLNLLLGQEYIITRNNKITNTAHGFPMSFTADNTFNLMTEGTPFEMTNYSSPDDKLLSFFSRANYNFMDKYLLSATFRADGSSKFSRGNRWGYFPSVAVAWRISSEKFMDDTKEWLDDLKLRASYGTAGNNGIPTGQLVQMYSPYATTWINGYTSYWAPAKTMANPDLKWETTVTRNIGLDFTMLGGKLNGTVEAYWNSTKDLLILFPTGGTGYDNQYRNMGETQNRGVEVTLNWTAINKKNFGLSFSGNIGFNKNKIKSLGALQAITNELSQTRWASTEIPQDFLAEVGGSVGKMYGFVSDGRYEVSDFVGYIDGQWVLKDGVNASSAVGTARPGMMKLKDLDGDGDVATASDADKRIIGDANPLHTGGFNINARIYGFDLAAGFSWSYGNDVYNANKIEWNTTSKFYYRNLSSEMASGKRWTNVDASGALVTDMEQLAALNTNTTMFSPYTDKYVFSDWAVEDGSFLRLNTLTLGYTLPAQLMKKVGVNNLRFYMTAYNVFCLTGYSGFDPEVSTMRRNGSQLTPGVDYSAYPKSRSFVIGVNLNF